MKALVLYALFTVALSAIPKDPAPSPIKKPSPEIVVPPPNPNSGQGWNNGGNKTPAERESDLIEQ